MTPAETLTGLRRNGMTTEKRKPQTEKIFGRQKESQGTLDSPGYRAHASSAYGADDVVIGGESSPFTDPNCQKNMLRLVRLWPR